MRAIDASIEPRRAAGVALAVMLGGCVTVRPVVLDRKTELENQILGTFQRLERELILASSVRGAAPAPKLSPLQREALEAMLNREFNRDDVDQLKAKQVVGEGNDGLLRVLVAGGEPAEAKRVQQLVEQENQDRMVIMRRVIQLDRALTDKDLPLVRRIFSRLMAQVAEPGNRVQQESGAWGTVREKPSKEGGR